MTVLEQLLIEQGLALRKVAAAIAGSWDGGEEIFAEACVRVLEKGKPSSTTDELAIFMNRIMRNLHYDARRYQRHRESLDFLLDEKVSVCDLMAHPEDVEGDLARLDQEKRDRIKAHRILREMPAQHAGVLYHVDMDGLGYDEAARVLGVELGTVRSRVSRGRAEFKKRWLRRRGRPNGKPAPVK